MYSRIGKVMGYMAVLTLVSSAALAANVDKFGASRTFEFDPDHTGCPRAQWLQGAGLSDANDNTNFGLQLEKNCAININASAGAVLSQVSGITLNSNGLGFDIKDGSPCGAGAPRFNVSASDGFHFMGGCANATKSPGVPVAGWTRVAIDPYNPAQAFPVLAAGATINTITLIVDEPGKYTLDNIQVNGVFIGKPGAAK
jgi:hypothetical protein